LFKIVNPSNEITSVIIEEYKANDLAVFSFLKKNAAMPFNNGANISNNAIIYYFLIKNWYNNKSSIDKTINST